MTSHSERSPPDLASGGRTATAASACSFGSRYAPPVAPPPASAVGPASAGSASALGSSREAVVSTDRLRAFRFRPPPGPSGHRGARHRQPLRRWAWCGAEVTAGPFGAPIQRWLVEFVAWPSCSSERGRGQTACSARAAGQRLRELVKPRRLVQGQAHGRNERTIPGHGGGRDGFVRGAKPRSRRSATQRNIFGWEACSRGNGRGASAAVTRHGSWRGKPFEGSERREDRAQSRARPSGRGR